MDRRQRKTEAAIMNAFMELMKKKDIDKITIQEIANRADVNRGTIYLRYIDKYDIFDRYIEIQLGELMESCRRNDNPISLVSKDDLTNIFKYLDDMRDNIRIILSEKGLPIFTEKMKTEIIKILLDQNKGGEQNMLTAVFLSSAVTGVLEWWLKTDDASYEDVAEELWGLLSRLY